MSFLDCDCEEQSRYSLNPDLCIKHKVVTWALWLIFKVIEIVGTWLFGLYVLWVDWRLRNDC